MLSHSGGIKRLTRADVLKATRPQHLMTIVWNALALAFHILSASLRLTVSMGCNAHNHYDRYYRIRVSLIASCLCDKLSASDAKQQ